MVAGKRLLLVAACALVDADGTLSEDPAVLYGPHAKDGPRDHTKGTGAIRAFGEHKGSGLAFICELLGGALTGTGATAPDRELGQDPRGHACKYRARAVRAVTRLSLSYGR